MTLEELLSALRSALSTLAALDAETDALDSWNGETVYADVSAAIDLTNGRDARLVMTISEPTAVELVKAIGGVEVDFEHELVPDVVGELLNVTAGVARKHDGGRWSLPTTARERRHVVRDLAPGRTRRAVARVGTGDIGLYLIDAA